MVNIAELLKGAPNGTKLYSPLFGEVKLVRVDKRRGYPINVIDCNGNGKSFTEFGVYFANHPDAECLLFPSKECRTWEGWTPCVESNFKVGDWVVRKDGETFYGGNYAEQITLIEVDEKGKCIWLSSTSWVNDDDIRLWTIQDAKDGDVLYSLDSKQPFIYKERPQFCQARGYCCINKFGEFGVWNTNKCIICTDKYIPATKEEREQLFSKMKEAGYEWDAYKKELKKIKPHYDIANFHAGMPVLVRDSNVEVWNYLPFSHYKKKWSDNFFAGGCSWSQCIPYNDDTKHLLGTTDMCPEEYINW